MLKRWLLGALALIFVATGALPVVDTEAARAPTPTRTPPPTRTPTPTRTPPPTRTPTPIAAGQAAQRRIRLPVNFRDPAPPRTTMAVGANVIDNNFELVRDMGFTWVKLYAEWDGADPEEQVDAALQRYPGVRILLGIRTQPRAWFRR